MLDEYFEINAGKIEVDSTILKSDAKEEEKKDVGDDIEDVPLRNEVDIFFREIRDLNFGALESKFSAKIHEIDDIFKRKDDYDTVDQL